MSKGVAEMRCLCSDVEKAHFFAIIIKIPLGKVLLVTLRNAVQ